MKLVLFCIKETYLSYIGKKVTLSSCSHTLFFLIKMMVKQFMQLSLCIEHTTFLCVIYDSQNVSWRIRSCRPQSTTMPPACWIKCRDGCRLWLGFDGRLHWSMELMFVCVQFSRIQVIHSILMTILAFFPSFQKLPDV